MRFLEGPCTCQLTNPYLLAAHILTYYFRRELLDEKPYLSEAGPAVFDALYDTVVRQVSYIVKSPPLSCNMVSLHALIKDSINVLIGVPSVTFCLDKVNK